MSDLAKLGSNALSLAFSTSTVLGNAETYDSGVLDLQNYTQVQTDILSAGVGGTLTIDFVRDAAGSDILRTLTIPYTADSGYKTFSSLAFTPYVRYRFQTSGAGQTDFYFDTKFTQVPLSPQILGLDDFVSEKMVGSITRSIMTGKTDGGIYKNVPLSPEGHPEVAIHDPILPFGSLHTESLTPIFQTDAVYGINLSEVVPEVGHALDGTTTATNTAANEMFKCSTGTTAFSYATMQSRERLRYRAGQGVVGRFTALWSTPAASSIVVAGYGSGESGYYFGYNGTSFGILHSTGGVRRIMSFEITTASTTTDDIQIELPSATGVRAYTVTNITSGTTTNTANEIAANTFAGWSVEARGDTVIFLRGAVGVLTGTPTIAQAGAGTPAAATITTVNAGVASTDTWIPQASWNGDVCDGTGATGFNLDVTKGNVFQINVAWLGFGAVTFKIMIPNTDGNNTNWATVHTINNPNARTTPHASQPAFPFTMAAYSAGSTTDVSLQVGSFAGFVEGDIRLTGPRSAYSNSQNNFVTTGALYPLFSVRNDRVHAHTGTTARANQSVVNILSWGGAHDDATPVTFYLLRNATLAGPVNWTKWSADSVTYYDEAATTATISGNSQIVQVLPLGDSGSLQVPLEDTTVLQPGETLTVAATAVTGTSVWTIGTLNIREDQ
jgi:hypothetical protein